MAEAAKWRDPKYKDRLYTQEPGDSDDYDNIGYGYDFPERPENDPGQKRRMGGVGSEFDRNDPLVKGQGIGRSGIKHSLNLAGKRKGLPSRDQITSLKGSIKDAHGKHRKPNLPEQGVAEGMEGRVVFSGTGANGSKYEIIQTGPTDFMIHANGRHIDTYSSLQRAMGVLKNEVPGLQQGVAEGVARSFDSQLIEILKQRGFKGPMAVGRAKKWIPAVKEVATNGNFSIGADDIIMVSGSDPDYDPWVLYVPKVGKYIYNEGMAYNLLTAKQVVKFTVPKDDDDFFEGVAEGEYKSRHIHRQEQNKKYDEYRRNQEAQGKKPLSRGDWAATQRKGQEGVAEGSSCNMTMEGKSCPMHGLKKCPGYKSNIEETTAGSVAGVVNPTPKNKAKVGTLFGGTYKQKKAKA